MSEFIDCYLWWLILGILLGFFLFWLYDLLFRRDGGQDQTGTGQQLAAAPADTPVDELTQSLVISEESLAQAKKVGFKPQKNGMDDLTILEGIGPKISQLMNQDGINTFRQMAAADIDNLQRILDEAGPSFKLAKPESWPKQAAICVKQDWEALKIYQDKLFNGIEFDD